MKILVLSDSHGSMQTMIDAVYEENPDHIIHLGDHVKDADRLAEIFTGLPVIRIAGNCDYIDTGSKHLIFELGGIRFLLTHGHQYGVKSGLIRITYAAMEAGVNVALFGHTHHAMTQEVDGIILMNPGSCGSVYPTYGVIEITRGIPNCTIKSIR